MSSKTKIVVLHLKELIYTGIFVLFGILFIIMLIIMFIPKDKKEEVRVEDKKTGKYIRGCGVNEGDWKNSKVVVGIFIGDVAYHSKGYGTDAMKVLVRFIFEQMNINKVKLEVYSFNKRAISCYEKVGFQVEGVLKEEIFRNGKYHDIIEMSIFKRDYFHSIATGFDLV